MQNREEAIRWLTDQGYLAFARDWNVGASIGISKRCRESSDGLSAFEPTLIYIYPADLVDRDGVGPWLVLPPICPSTEFQCRNLHEAVLRALEILEACEKE